MQTRTYHLPALLIIVAVVLFVFVKARMDKKPEPITETNQQSSAVQLSENSPQVQAQFNSEPDSNALLPDLQVKKMDDAYITFGTKVGKILRFPGTFANIGDGPLELIATSDKENNITRASQRIYKKDGSYEEKLVGNFMLHPTHGHWHFEDFVEFGLYSLKNEDELDQKLLDTGKMTFCIHDYAPLSEEFSAKPSKIVYPWCATSIGTQGISVGWVDTYTADVPGQELNITEIPDGRYAFRAVADPDNRVMEKDENNNVTITFIEISGNAVKILP